MSDCLFLLVFIHSVFFFIDFSIRVALVPGFGIQFVVTTDRRTPIYIAWRACEFSFCIKKYQRSTAVKGWGGWSTYYMLVPYKITLVLNVRNHCVIIFNMFYA